MTWDTYHRRGEVLRTVIAEANARGDGALPMDLPGVAETFGDELTLIGVLQLRWHTRLAGTIERELAVQSDLYAAVLTAWRRTATELSGVRQILDAYTRAPTSAAMDKALAKAAHKDWTLLAAMAGRAGAQEPRASTVGCGIEEHARQAMPPKRPHRRHVAA